MLIEIFLALIIGIIFGTLSGLIPGIHINLIGVLLISLTASIYLNPIYTIVFITAMAITHTFVDFIPSIFLGCPDTDTELSVLPGHELLKTKRGYEAIYLSNKGSVIAIFILVAILIPSLLLIPKIYPIIKPLIPYLLILIVTIMILTEKRKLNALLVFFITGILGLALNTLEINQPLLPLLTGLFGASNIILSMKNKTIIPEQIITKSKLSIKRPLIGALIFAPICSFTPGVGSGQAAIIANTIIKNSRKQFLVLTGIINTLVMAFSFLSLYLINKTRTGAAATIQTIMPALQPSHLILILTTIIITTPIAHKITDNLAKKISRGFTKINYRLLSYTTLTILTLLTLTISGPKGIFVLTISTLTGIYSISLKTKRTNMMGCLILPTIIWLI
ncbi:MAG: tripartite tricarboxylate transporter permease [Nanoarchaeota archaeon]|jgi:putative membrane protein|nr:tripartite tricarboxylate transporter permease [Nanoarchaeota archaeon]